jgi:hypothetical protein
MMMTEWRIDYSIVKGFAKGNPGRLIVVSADESQARALAYEAASIFHDEIKITGIQPL